MRANVLAIDAVLADGAAVHMGEVSPDLSDVPDAARAPGPDAARHRRAGGGRKSKRAFPRCTAGSAVTISMRWTPRRNRINLAHILVGSEGTLAYSTAIELALSPVLGRRALGVCHFGSFHGAMDAAQHLVTLKPIAVELVDSTMLGLAAEIAMFRPTLDAMLKGTPEAILLVEFDSGEEENRRRMTALGEVMGDLGFDFSHAGGNGAAWSRSMTPRCRTRSPNCANPASTS